MEHDDNIGDELDRLLAAAPAAPPVPPELARRILADFDSVQRRWSFGRLVRRAADAVWPGAPVWQPACAFTLSLLIGLGVAAFAPFDISRQDDSGSKVFALDGPPDIDAGQGI